MYGPTRIFWANLTPFSLKSYEGEFRKSAEDNGAIAVAVKAYPMSAYPDGRLVHTKVRKTPSWPRSWANFSLF
jgi:hypothetical protein